MRAAFSVALLFLACGLSAANGQEAQAELVGPVSQDELFLALPEWQDRMVSYEPRFDAVSALKDIQDFIQIEIYFGSWCSDSAIQVPAVIQVLNLVNSPQIQVNLIGVPEDQNARDPYIAGKDIEKIPTVIVWLNGLEKGRIVEKPDRTVEEDLLNILRR